MSATALHPVGAAQQEIVGHVADARTIVSPPKKASRPRAARKKPIVVDDTEAGVVTDEALPQTAVAPGAITPIIHRGEITPENAIFVSLCFEGPDSYVTAGGIAVTGSTGEDYAEPLGNAVALETDDPDELVGALEHLIQHPEDVD